MEVGPQGRIYFPQTPCSKMVQASDYSRVVFQTTHPDLLSRVREKTLSLETFI